MYIVSCEATVEVVFMFLLRTTDKRFLKNFKYKEFFKINLKVKII